jgi:hypothetical protein
LLTGMTGITLHMQWPLTGVVVFFIKNNDLICMVFKIP